MAPDDLQSKATDFMKKVLTVGVGTFFLTEESLRALVTDFKLPKELLTAILESAGKTKNEFMERLSSDVLDRVMTKVDLTNLVQEILTRNELELSVKLKFHPRDREQK